MKESLEFRFKFISELHEHLSNDKHKFNLKFHEILALKEFLRSKPFSIIEADKNVGACIISNELKDRLTLDSLNDSNTYLKLDYNPISNSISFINSELKKLNENKFLSNSFYKKLLVKDSAKLGAYRIMLKLHKSKFGIRPIVNCNNNITSKLCLFIDLLLKPLVRETESFLQDSQHLLQICEKIDLEAGDYYLYSCDFESLYTNIDLSLAMDLILDTLIENDIIDNNYNIFAVKTILNLIFTQNFFTYNGEHYSQVKGIAMGAICGPSIANIVVYKLEKSWLYIHKPLIYKRYIDDIFIVTKKPLNKIEFSKQFKNLKLNIVSGDIVQFLDLIIYIDKIKLRFGFSLYIKPTNSFSFLKFNSNHPKHIFNNIPISCLIRIRRICSNYIDYLYFSRSLLIQLLSRGYNFKFLIHAIHNVGNMDRYSLIKYKVKDNSDLFKDKIIISMKYNDNFIEIKKHLYNSWNILDTNSKIITKSTSNNTINPNIVSNKKTLFITYGVNNNLKRLLVYNFKLERNFNFRSSPFNKLGCKICPYMDSTKIFKFHNGLSLPILNNNNCDAKNCIYIFYCNLCVNCYYIGETTNFRNRFSTHKSCIINFKPIGKINSEVAEHFNLKGHNFKTNLKIIIFKSNIIDDDIRKSIEDELMFICDYSGTSLINIKRRNLHFVKKFFTFDVT